MRTYIQYNHTVGQYTCLCGYVKQVKNDSGSKLAHKLHSIVCEKARGTQSDYIYNPEIIKYN